MAGTPGHSGGRRKGKPGGSYANRSDLRQPARAVPGQEYGKAGAQLEAQKQIPLSAGPSAPSPASGAAAMAGMVGGGGQPVIPLDAPSARPNEPLTAGLSGGAGPGREALNLPPQISEDQRVLATLQGLYQAYPNSDVAALIAELNARG